MKHAQRYRGQKSNRLSGSLQNRNIQEAKRNNTLEKPWPFEEPGTTRISYERFSVHVVFRPSELRVALWRAAALHIGPSSKGGERTVQRKTMRKNRKNTSTDGTQADSQSELINDELICKNCSATGGRRLLVKISDSQHDRIVTETFRCPSCRALGKIRDSINHRQPRLLGCAASSTRCEIKQRFHGFHTLIFEVGNKKPRDCKGDFTHFTDFTPNQKGGYVTGARPRSRSRPRRHTSTPFSRCEIREIREIARRRRGYFGCFHPPGVKSVKLPGVSNGGLTL